MVTRRYLWDGQLRIVAEPDGSGNLVSQYVYGTKVNVPEYMQKGGVTYRLITDQLGSVRLVVNASTGAVVQRIDYDEFGVVTSDTNPGFQPFGFAGGLYDPDTKLVRFGARDYDAETGRWTGKDQLSFESDDTNLYGYSVQDPVNFLDYEGYDSSTAAAAAAPVLGFPALWPLAPLAICVLAYDGYSLADDVINHYREHTKNKRKSTKNKHDRGDERRARDNRGEKGDARRPYRAK